MSRAWDRSATDMRQAFQTGAGTTWNGLADDARRTFARGWDQSASDMRQAFQRGASGAASSAADDMRRDFSRGWDRSAEDMRDAFRRAAQQAGGDMSDAMRGAGESAGQQGGDAAGEGMLSGIKGKAGAIAAGLGIAFAAAGGIAADQFADSFTDALDKEKSLDLAQARLGADESTMNRVGAAAGAAYADAFGESIGDNIDTARQAIQAGLIDPDATAQDIQKVISQLSGISELIGGDLTEATRAVSNMMRNGLVASAEEGLDILTVGYKAAGLGSDDLLESVNQYASGWKNTGLTGAQAMALIGQSIRNGAPDTDRAGDALREFGRRVTEEGEAIVESLNKIGLNGTEMYEKFKAGGPEAFEAFDQAFDTISKIPDVTDRNTAAMSLLGDTAGDFIGTLAQWDPSAAMDEFGNSTGAANSAIQVMGANAATSIDSAKQSWELAMSKFGGAFAQVVGPELAKFADWVSDHQPEILGFLGGVADGAFAMTDAFLLFSTGGLNALGMATESIVGLLGGITNPIGKIAEVVGRLTGNDGLEDFGRSMQEVDTKVQNFADSAYDMAATIEDTVRPKLDEMRNSVGDNITTAQNAEQVMRALGDSVTAIPTEHGIAISENSPEITQRLEALGLKVTTLPDGRVEVTANTAAADQMMRDFIARNGGQQVKVDVLAVYRGVTTGGSVPLPGNAHGTDARGIRAVPGLAGGGRAGRTPAGVLYGPGTPTSDDILGIGADGVPTARVSPGEGVVREDIMRRGGGEYVAAMNAGWVPPVDLLRAMVPGLAGGGVAGQRATSWAQGKNGLPYIYGPQDCSWYQSGIYNQLTGKSVRFTTASDLASFGFKRGSDPTGFTVGTNGGVGEGGHMTGRLLGVPVESDGTNGVQFGGRADGPESMPQQWFLPRDLWVPPETDDTSKGSSSGGVGTQLGGGAGAPGGGGASSGGSGGSGGSSTGGTGGTFNGQEVPAGVTPVWIVNAGSTSTLEPTTPTTSDAAGASTGTSATGPKPAEMPDVNGRLQGAANDFGNATLDQFLGDVGLRRSGGAVQNLVKVLLDHVAATAAAEAAAQVAQQGRATSQFAGRLR